MNARAKEMAAAIEAETSGRVDLQVFPSNQLGSDTDMLSQIRSGGVEFFALSGLILSTLVAAASINGVGFAFPDYDTVWKAMDGDLGAHVRGEIKKAGLEVMDKIWDNGFRQTTSSTGPINGPDDFKGFKIRVPVSPLWTSMFKASMQRPPRSISTRSTPRCRPRSSRARKIRWRSSRPIPVNIYTGIQIPPQGPRPATPRRYSSNTVALP
jgi:TRAP-type C4-dicarboxylate transport system substrate-binding protein